MSYDSDSNGNSRAAFARVDGAPRSRDSARAVSGDADFCGEGGRRDASKTWTAIAISISPGGLVAERRAPHPR